ncbi:ATP-binding cassette domain-containing protein [Streptomyces triticirhizae]|uniref:ABC transporter ATP-binding protein n=1 Tax=Streptomyces triticirhizae TaxID=2483353 RepID=A0A3M2L034_9ACTN|nr:ABC transporter ATP-binding protein [Streptomyces triticirhizae]RMI30764.1 ABC transporter ATP-binding protein [Streptomyces triticirhizae]
MTRHLLRLLAARPGPQLLLDACWTLLRTTLLLTGLLLQAALDTLANGSGDWGQIPLWAGLLAVNEAARLALWYGLVLPRLEPGYTYTVRAGLQDRVLDALLARPAGAAPRHPTGEVVSRLGGDADEVGVFAIWSASNVARLLVAGAAVAVLWATDVRATLALVALIALVTAVGRALGGPVERHRAASRAAAGEVGTRVAEIVGGLATVRAGRAEERVVARLAEANAVRRRAAVRDEVLTSLQGAVLRATTALGTGAVLLLVAGQMRAGRFSLGDLALFLAYLPFVTEAVHTLGTLPGRVRQAGVSLGRLAQLADGPARLVTPAPVHLRAEPPPSAPPPARSPLERLTATGLGYRHADGQRALRGIDLELTAGSATVVTGPVGAGKSTLLRLVAGQLPPGEGELWWNGQRIARPQEFLVPPRCGYLPQEARLFSGTLRENILLGREPDESAVRAAVRLALLEDDLARMPDGLETVVGPRGQRLSGGQVRRVALARLLSREPELLVLDDPLAGLDIDTARALWTNLRARRRALLLVAHEPWVLREADAHAELPRA